MTEVTILGTAIGEGMIVANKDNQKLSFAYSERSPKTISLFMKEGAIDASNIEIVINKDEIEKVLLFLKGLCVGK